MRIYSVSAANYQPNVNYKMSKLTAPVFKNEQNEIVVLPSGATYEIDEESIKNFPPRVQDSFRAAVKEVEPYLDKEGDDNIKHLHFIFKGYTEIGDIDPYNIHLEVCCPDIEKFREIVMNNRGIYEKRLSKYRDFLWKTAVERPHRGLESIQDVDKAVAEETRSDEDYAMLAKMSEARAYYSFAPFDIDTGKFHLPAMIREVEDSNSETLNDFIFSLFLRASKKQTDKK